MYKNNHGRAQKFGRNECTFMDIDGDEEQNGKQRSFPLSSFLSPLLSSRPRSLLSTAVYMAGLFSLTGCESHETGGHQGPGPPRQHAPPQSAVRSVPQPSPSLPLSLSHSTLTISFTISNISSLRLSVFPSCTIYIFFPVTSRLSSIRFSVCACHFLSLILPPSFCPPVALSYCHICMF